MAEQHDSICTTSCEPTVADSSQTQNSAPIRSPLTPRQPESIENALPVDASKAVTSHDIQPQHSDTASISENGSSAQQTAEQPQRQQPQPRAVDRGPRNVADIQRELDSLMALMYCPAGAEHEQQQDISRVLSLGNRLKRDDSVSRREGGVMTSSNSTADAERLTELSLI